MIARNSLGAGTKYQSVSDIYEYDQFGNVARLMVNITKDDGITFDKGYTKETFYDVLGREKTISYNNGDFGVWYEYNSGLNTEKIGKKLLNGALEVVVLNIDYTADGRVARQENANGAVIANTYDPNRLNRLVQKTTTSSDGTKLEDFSYVYDKVGNILEQRVSGDVGYPAVNTYSYDDLYRLVKVTSTANKDPNDNYEQSYRYSPVGNILYKSDQGDYVYPSSTPTNGPSLNPEAVVSISLNDVVRKQFGYDLRGNVNNGKKFDEAGKLLTDTSYTWDYRNRLTYGAVNDVAVGTTSGYYFSYDYVGQRVLKSSADKSHVNYYPFEGFEEEVGANGYKKTYSIAIGADETVKQMFSSEQNGGIFMASTMEEPIKKMNEVNVVNMSQEIKLNNGMYYFYNDHLGSGSVVTDSIGKIVQAIDYYPFGGVRHEFVDSGFLNDYLYTGKERDEEIGVYYYGVRYYNADIGKFLSIDPAVQDTGSPSFKNKYGRSLQNFLREPQRLNVYAYAGNNPIIGIDPYGAVTEVIIDRDATHGTPSKNFLGQFFGDHAMIRVNDYVFENTPDGPQIGRISKFELDYKKQTLDIVELNLTEKQENKMLEFFANMSNLPPLSSFDVKQYGSMAPQDKENYGYSFNCVGTVEDALRHAEIGKDLHSITPKGFYNELKDLRGSSGYKIPFTDYHLLQKDPYKNPANGENLIKSISSKKF